MYFSFFKGIFVYLTRYTFPNNFFYSQLILFFNSINIRFKDLINIPFNQIIILNSNQMESSNAIN
jgi:hypothetical protein